VRLLLLPWLVFNIGVAATYAYDKWQAKRGGPRVSERTLLGLAVAFGSVGALAGMQLARHKTKKMKFVVGVPLILLAQLLFFVLTRSPE
jgi:uncharacterized membrane protein YsdA (DUF1294 family)